MKRNAMVVVQADKSQEMGWVVREPATLVWSDQGLPMGADGQAGACGRLRCCLRFEYEQYRQVNRALPRIGEEVPTPNGTATVIVGHRIKETVSVRYGDDQVLEWPLSQVERLSSSRN